MVFLKGKKIVSLPEDGDVKPATPSARDAVDVAWAREVMGNAIRHMRVECESSRRMDVCGVFEARVLRPTLGGASPVPYSALVKEDGLRTPLQAANLLTTAKRKFLRALRAVVREHVRDEARVEAEISELRAVLAAGAPSSG